MASIEEIFKVEVSQCECMWKTHFSCSSLLPYVFYSKFISYHKNLIQWLTAWLAEAPYSRVSINRKSHIKCLRLSAHNFCLYKHWLFGCIAWTWERENEADAMKNGVGFGDLHRIFPLWMLFLHWNLPIFVIVVVVVIFFIICLENLDRKFGAWHL